MCRGQLALNGVKTSPVYDQVGQVHTIRTRISDASKGHLKCVVVSVNQALAVLAVLAVLAALAAGARVDGVFCDLSARLQSIPPADTSSERSCARMVQQFDFDRKRKAIPMATRREIERPSQPRMHHMPNSGRR